MKLYPLASALLCAAALPLLADSKTKTLDIYWVDVEGGAATLIVTPQGESVLVDTGNPGGRDSKRIHHVAAEVAGLKKIDHLITTHMHIDHFGGAAELAALIPISEVHDNGIPNRDPDNSNPKSDEAFAKRIKPYADIPAKHSVIHPGDRIELGQPVNGEKLQLRCLGAKQQFISSPGGTSTECKDAKRQEKDTSDNANSIVLLLEYGAFKFFDGGDLTWNVEEQLVCPEKRVGPVDVYQVNHHGLDISNNPILVHALAPTVSVMSNGTQKGCGAETFATLKSSPGLKAMYQIHRNLRADKQNNASEDRIANLEAKCDANYIMLSVEPSSRSYTVSIPARGHKETFATK